MTRTPIQGSSNILGIGYDHSKMLLEIEFHNGGIYNYTPFTQEGYELFMKADSKGAFFAKNIKDAEGIICTRID